MKKLMMFLVLVGVSGSAFAGQVCCGGSLSSRSVVIINMDGRRDHPAPAGSRQARRDQERQANERRIAAMLLAAQQQAEQRQREEAAVVQQRAPERELQLAVQAYVAIQRQQEQFTNIAAVGGSDDDAPAADVHDVRLPGAAFSPTARRQSVFSNDDSQVDYRGMGEFGEGLRIGFGGVRRNVRVASARSEQGSALTEAAMNEVRRSPYGTPSPTRTRVSAWLDAQEGAR